VASRTAARAAIARGTSGFLDSSRRRATSSFVVALLDAITSVVANLDESVREDVLKKPVNELVGREGAGPVSARAEMDALP
jgi:hypothetical protein